MAACPNFGDERMKIAVVGAGIAGLAVALGCEQADHDVTLFEAGSTVGGRMKTYQHEGHFIDAGFHVLHTAYSTVQRWIDVPALKAKPMDNCTVTIHPPTGRKRLLGDALRSPQYLLPTLKSIGIRDGLRFFKWRLGTSSRDLERSLDAPSSPISQALSQRRFRPSTQRVLEPLFAGITLDPTLSERFAFADFTWGAMAHGTMVVPQGGIGAVPQQLAGRLRTTTILLNTEITDVSEKSVVANGATHTFDLVILAVPQHVAARLLPKTLESHQPVERLTSTVVFAASRPPFKHARLLLNETWGTNESQVLHVHIPTNLHPHPHGHHWIAATLVGKAAEAPDPHNVQRELKGWFGSSTDQWEHVYTTTVRHALPHIDPEHHQRVLPDLELDGVLVVGDHRTHPSVQGALASAERALSHLGIPLPTR